MSVDIEEMGAHLDAKRQADVKEQYDTRATNATTAFLLCFFMGYLGAHRFYLGQWRSGLAHLALFALGAAGVVGGFVTSAPLDAALFVIGGLLVLASLIWEVIDLGRIDDEIHRRNLLLAEGLIAGALLSDTSAMEGAARKLDEVTHTAAAQSQAAGAAPALAASGAISAEDLAQARQLAEQSGHASISYEAISTFNVSATPEERAGEHPDFEPATTSERRVNTQPLPMGQETAPAIEAETHTHSVEGYHVTDAIETDRVSGPSAGEALGIGAAALGAAGLGFGLAEAAHTHEAPSAVPAETVAEQPAPAISDMYERPPEAPKFTPDLDTAPLTSLADGAMPFAPFAPPAPEPPAPEPPAYAAPAPELAHAADVTDSGAPNFMEPASDVAFASAYPSFVTLPEQPMASADAVTQPDIPLYFSDDALPAAEPAADTYAPPVPELYSAAPQAEPAAPAWDAPTEPVAPDHEPNRFAEAAGLGALAGAGALAADAWGRHEQAPAEPVAEAAPVVPEAAIQAEPAAPPAPKMKRIRVKHRIVVEGQVVREEVVEREVPADADMAAAARQIQAELEAGASPSADEIARLAHLSSDEEVEVRRRVEGLGH